MNKKLFIFDASIIFLAISGIAGANNNMFLLSPHAKSPIIISDSSLVNSLNQEDADETTGLSRNAKIAIGVGVGALAVGGIVAAIMVASGDNGKETDKNITIQVDTEPANQHLSYRAFDIINSSTQDYQITSLSLVSAAAGAAAHNELKLCSIDDGANCSSGFVSTCKPNEILPSGKTCKLWLHAVDGTAPFGPQTAILTIGVKNTVDTTFGKQGKFTINYSRDLYACGIFTVPMEGYNIAKWNGSKWNALGGGLDGVGVFALTQDKNGDLIAGGIFTAPMESYNIAKWNGSKWNALGTTGLGGSENAVLAVAQDKNGDLIAGGRFPIGTGTYNIAKLDADTQTWSALGSGLGGDTDGVASLLIVPSIQSVQTQ